MLLMPSAAVGGFWRWSRSCTANGQAGTRATFKTPITLEAAPPSS
jgi:hypothetical protein